MKFLLRSGSHHFFFFFNLNLFNWRLITLQYCTGFAIHQHESATGVHMLPILNPAPLPSPYHPSGSSQCTSPKHPVSCIKPSYCFPAAHFLCLHALLTICHLTQPAVPLKSLRTQSFSEDISLCALRHYRSPPIIPP